MTFRKGRRVDFGVNIDFVKSDSRGGFVRGWAYVASDEDGQVVDYSGDIIGGLTVDEAMTEVRKMAHEFIISHRVAKVLHNGSQIGEFVESVIIDDEFAKAIGASTKRRGWWVGMRVDDEAVRKQVRDGKLRQFSIGGRGVRVPVKEAA
jgi:hypothetical protein